MKPKYILIFWNHYDKPSCTFFQTLNNAMISRDSLHNLGYETLLIDYDIVMSKNDL